MGFSPVFWLVLMLAAGASNAVFMALVGFKAILTFEWLGSPKVFFLKFVPVLAFSLLAIFSFFMMIGTALGLV